jgi:cyclopropane fatty-acyl-phospholipid synthase-like methyltransferase
MKIFLGPKKVERYNGMVIKADLHLHEQIADRIRSQVAVGRHVLDLGAGEGALSARLVDLGYQVTAVDKDEASFKCSEVTFRRVDFDQPAEVSAFVDEFGSEFDAVLGIEVIEHVKDQWQYVSQLMRLVKPGGLILITTPNTSSWLSRLQFFFTGRFHQFGNSDLSYGHISPVTSWELDLILRRSGAVDINIQSAGTLPALYLTGFNRMSILNVFVLPLRFLMRGMLDGWCVMATARRPS